MNRKKKHLAGIHACFLKSQLKPTLFSGVMNTFSDCKVEGFLTNSRTVTCWHAGLHTNYTIYLQYFAHWPKYKDLILLYARPIKCYLLCNSFSATPVTGPPAYHKSLVAMEYPTRPRTKSIGDHIIIHEIMDVNLCIYMTCWDP